MLPVRMTVGRSAVPVGRARCIGQREERSQPLKRRCYDYRYPMVEYSNTVRVVCIHTINQSQVFFLSFPCPARE